MRGWERLVLVIAIAVPLLVVTVGWPMVVEWISGPPAPQPTPQVAGTVATPGAAATQAAAAQVARATPRPTVGAPATLQTDGQAAAPAAALTPAPIGIIAADHPQTAREVAAAQTNNPTQAVQNFYALVSSHQFDAAQQMWSPHMLSAFPPQENLYQRFSNTQAIQLQRADVVSQDQSRATVAVDLVESDSGAGQHHYVGNWYLVRGPSGAWMLDQPDLRTLP